MLSKSLMGQSLLKKTLFIGGCVSLLAGNASVSLCVTNASSRSRGSRACSEINSVHTILKKKKTFTFPITVPVHERIHHDLGHLLGSYLHQEETTVNSWKMS